MLTESLLKIYQYFFDQASEQAGIPAYMYGNENTGGGGGDTATGLSMLMNNASKALKAVITHIDDLLIKPIVYEHWVNIMLFDDDELKCGDINVVARASEYLLMQKTYQLRRLELASRKCSWRNTVRSTCPLAVSAHSLNNLIYLHYDT